jgi:hypothetical protein
MRLIGYGDLMAQRLPRSSHWKIPLSSVLALEESRAEQVARAIGVGRNMEASEGGELGGWRRLRRG